MDLLRIALVFLLSTQFSLGVGQTIHFGEQFKGLHFADPDSAGYRRCSYWELEDGTHLHTDCTPYNMQRCGKPAKYTYKCCAGFEEDKRAFEVYSGFMASTCNKMLSPFAPCTEAVLKSEKHAAFGPQLAALAEMEDWNSDEVYTIFAPQVDEEQAFGVQTTDHVVKGRYYTAALKDGMELPTLDGRRKLYVSKYPYGITTVDCVEILDADLECRSGLVHRIRHPLGEGGNGAEWRSVLAFLQSHPDTMAFADDLPADLKHKLDTVESGMRYTILAPRSQTWSAIKQKYTGEKLQQIAASHVLTGHICSGGLIGLNNKKSNVPGHPVNIVCEIDPRDGQEKRYILTDCGERRDLVEMDMIAANGVIHLLDEPMIPLSALTLKDIVENERCAAHLKVTEVAQLFKECDLHMDPEVRYAVLLPRDEAFQWWSTYEQFKEEYKRFQVDNEYRCRVARYHVMRSNEQLDSVNDFASHTMGHRTNNKDDYLYETTYFTKTFYGSQLHFHYSPVIDMRSLQADGVSLYLTPRINVPPEQNISQILAERQDTTITNQKTVEVNMDEKHFSANAPKNLYLVTTDDGWKDPRAKPDSVGQFRPEYTMFRGEALESFLLLHHVPIYLWGGDIGYFKNDSVQKFMSSAGVELTFWQDSEGVMRIGHDGMPQEQWPRVVKWNLPAKDGIMWLLDGILKCPDSVCPLYVEDIDYYDMYVAACRTAHLPNEPNAAEEFNKRPTDVASRHPDECTVILQLSEKSINLMEA